MQFEPSNETQSPPYIPPRIDPPGMPPVPAGMYGPSPKKPRKAWPWFAASAACLVLSVAIGVAVALPSGDEPTAASAPTAAPTTSPPLYVVAKTWPAGDGLGAGATLVVASESKSQAQAAANQYLGLAEPKGQYLYVEVLGHEDATTWICAGEILFSEADKEYAIFDMSELFTNFPADWIECRD